jgi:hypothetical protein
LIAYLCILVEECFAGSPAIELLKATSRLMIWYLNSSGEISSNKKHLIV